MSVDRPTLHESWYRVAELRPRLRSMVQSYRQQYRGKTWHVLRDPSNNKFFRLDDASYLFVGLLDGRRTVDEVWKLTSEELEDAAPTQGEAIQLLGQLYTSNLIEAELPPDAAGLFDRRTKRVNREVRGYLMNVLFAKVPLWDPDQFLDRWVGLVGWMFGPVGLALWAVLIVSAVFQLMGSGSALVSEAAGVLDPDNLFWLYVASVLTKFLHELGHGFSCKHFGQQDGSGGEVHTMGIMLMVFIPIPYVDASSAWAFRSKWKRAFVGAAGMYVELALAAVAAFIWVRTAENTPINAIAYNVMFISSVTTLLFNANPLIRFDGYYILSDLIEMPNLAQRSKEYLNYVVKKFAYKVRRPRDPSRTNGEVPWLVGYGISSAIYRVFLSVTILLYVADQLFFIGAIFAIVGVIGFVFVPLGKFVRYLVTNPELERTRARAVLVTVGTIALILLPLASWPVPDRGRADGVVEPRGYADVYAGADGFIEHVLPSGTRVAPGGDPLLIARSFELESERRRHVAQQRELEARYRKAMQDDPATAQPMLDQLDAIEEKVRRVDDQLARLRVAAPFEGVWVCGELDRVAGGFITQGRPIGRVVTPGDMVLRVTADQYLGPRLGEAERVEVRVKGRPGQQFEGRIVRRVEAGRRELPSVALGYAAGGGVQESQERGQEGRAAVPFFEVHVEAVDAAQEALLLSGQRVVARFDLPDKPLLAQGWTALRQLLQKRFQI